MRWFWYARGHLTEGRSWLEQALAMHGWVSAESRAKALGAVGWLANEQGDINRAEEAAAEGL